MDALTAMHATYQGAYTYRIEIRSPTDTCKYIILGKIYRAWTEDFDSEAYDLIQEQIDKLVSCT